MSASNLRYVARSALRGKWPVSIAVALIAVLLGAKESHITFDVFHDTDIQALQQGDWSLLASMVNTTAVIALLVLSVVWFIIGAATELGFNLYNIKLVQRTQDHSFATLFDRFSVFGSALALRLLIFIFTTLWSLLFVIPGIIAQYRYAMAPYLLAQHPEMSAMEALDRSKELMRGNKWRLFCLQISFIGWMILASIPAGLGYFILNPYIYTAEAAFYLELTGQLQVQAEA